MWRRRLLSVAASSPTHGEQLYTGRLSDAVRKLKLLSVSSCAVTVVTSPLFLLLESAASPGIRAAMSAMFLAFSFGTTTALHTVSKRYVTAIYQSGDSGTIDVQTLSLLGRPKTAKFDVAAIRRTETVPFATFVDMKTNRALYIHKEDVQALIDSGKLPAGFGVGGPQLAPSSTSSASM
ncbi:unnamed protein product (mitochondrion) [Plasmodiophora brassicae]|uniref:Uncharacterized protein n=1 Tax=Plasmodiophora brassicae TaxID=37360 RepID=A0A3P3YCB7_PLABS|nr:unnamed protein product [Plasmodiophora brassicae]